MKKTAPKKIKKVNIAGKLKPVVTKLKKKAEQDAMPRMPKDVNDAFKQVDKLKKQLEKKFFKK